MNSLQETIELTRKCIRKGKTGDEATYESQRVQVTRPCREVWDRIVDLVRKGQSSLLALANEIDGDYDQRNHDADDKAVIFEKLKRPFTEWETICKGMATAIEQHPKRQIASYEKEMKLILIDEISRRQEDINRAVNLADKEIQILVDRRVILRTTLEKHWAEVQAKARHAGYIFETAKQLLHEGGSDRFDEEWRKAAQVSEDGEKEITNIDNQKQEFEDAKQTILSLNEELKTLPEQRSRVVTFLYGILETYNGLFGQFAVDAGSCIKRIDAMITSASSTRNDLAEGILEITLLTVKGIDHRVTDLAQQIVEKICSDYGQGVQVPENIMTLRVKIEEQIHGLPARRAELTYDVLSMS